MDNEQDPQWKQQWKTLGIRYLGKEGTGHIDAMDRFEHSWELGYTAAMDYCRSVVDKVGAELNKNKESN